MTAQTPIERGAEAIAGEYDRRGHLKPGAWWRALHRRADLRMEARAVFESIDQEGLAKAALEGLRLTKHGYRFNPEVAATAILDWLLSEGGA